MWLSLNEGAGWDYTGYDQDKDNAVTVYPGMLMESKRATPYAMVANGVATIKTKFIVRSKWFWMPDTTIEDTSVIVLNVPYGSL